MAKGWSFGGLVAALKSAAFLNAGTARGEVITVGQKNAQIPTTAFVRNFNFNTYTFVNGEVLYVEMNSAVNIPSELEKWNLSSVSGSYVIVTVLGITDNSRATILVSHGGAARPPIMYYSQGPSGDRSYTAHAVMTCKNAGTMNINLLTEASDVGIYYQEADVNAGSAGGYPAAMAGTLEVLPTAYNVQQRYTSIYGNVWVRSRTLDASQNWTDWREFARENWAEYSFLRDIRLASYQEANTWRGYGYRDESGWVITAIINATADEYIDHVGRRKLQKYVNGAWYDSYSV